MIAKVLADYLNDPAQADLVVTIETRFGNFAIDGVEEMLDDDDKVQALVIIACPDRWKVPS